MRWTLTVALLASLVLIPSSPASAGTLTTTNACRWTFDSLWRDQAIDLTGTGSPASVAPASGIALTGGSIHARLPDWVGEIGANMGVLKPGDNQIPVNVWVALGADGTPQGAQVVPLSTTVNAYVTAHPDGTYTVTPFDVTIPLPDTAWTAPGVAGTVAWHQAGAGSLPTIPGAAGGVDVTPKGSVFISVTIGSFGVQLDCQPGTAPREGTSFTATTAGPFETVEVVPGAVVVPAPKPKAPVVTLRTTKLKRSGKSVSVSIACTDAPCKGTVTMTRATKKVSYSLAAGAKKTVKLALSKTTVKSLKKKSLLVTVKVSSEGGTTVTKKLRLK